MSDPTQPQLPPLPTPAPRSRISGLGIAAIVLAVIAVLPTIIVLIIASTPDNGLYGWYLFATFPAGFITAIIGLVLGIIGIVLARSRSTPMVVPVVGTVCNAAILIGALLVFVPLTL